ncbi:hypothetical protein AAZX31_20G107800 [Glycine max]
MVLEVVLSNDCYECYNFRGGQCLLVNHKTFNCSEAEKHYSKSEHVMLLLGLVTVLSIILSVLIIGCLFRGKLSNINQER